MSSGSRTVRAPRGAELSCKGWVQEAVLRMLHNNLDPEVAERPDDLVVYGGTGKAARSWDAFDVIVRELRELGNTTRRSSSNRGKAVRQDPPPQKKKKKKKKKKWRLINNEEAKIVTNDGSGVMVSMTIAVTMA